MPGKIGYTLKIKNPSCIFCIFENLHSNTGDQFSFPLLYRRKTFS